MLHVSGKNIQTPTYIIFVYDSSNRNKRKILWKDLKCALPRDQHPCIIMGDFNAILSSIDKKSIHAKGRRCNLFGHFVDSCNLQDLRYVGPVFTWQRSGTMERLDRALVNDAWISAFPQCTLYHLPRVK